jgi:glutathione S-transferase
VKEGFTDGRLYHVALPEDWEAAEHEGAYPWSTRGMRVDHVGFVHLSYAHQWAGVIERFYGDRPDAVVLVVDPTRLDGEVRDEPAPDTGELFPHLYARLPVDAVVGRIDAVGRVDAPHEG